MIRRILVMSLIGLLVLVFCGYGKDEPVELPKTVTGKDGAEMVLIPAGDFQMGTDKSEIPQLVKWAKKRYKYAKADWFMRETPRHRVYLDSFHIDKYAVTNGQYARFLNEYGKNTDGAGHELLDIGIRDCLIEKKGDTYKPKAGYADHPTIMVSWYGAAAYAQFYNKRLPTEAQWEKAARGGSAKERFPWGDNDPDGTQCNFADKNTDYPEWSDKNADDGYKKTAPVGSYPAYGYGLHDMAGNVWEWCADEYDANYYNESMESNPTGPGNPVIFENDDFTKVKWDAFRVLRGGSWNSRPDVLRAGYRLDAHPLATLVFTPGFRCVVDY